MNAHPDGGQHCSHLRDLNTVAAIIDALSHASRRRRHQRDSIAGATPADLIGSLLCLPIKIRKAVRLATHALQSCDIIVEPETAATSHLTYT